MVACDWLILILISLFIIGTLIYFFFQLFDTLKGINIVGSAQLFIINPIGFIINMLAFMAQLFDIISNMLALHIFFIKKLYLFIILLQKYLCT